MTEHRNNSCRILVRHWLPIVTICPVNHLPDLIYITVEFEDEFKELYEVRRQIRKCASWKKMFMEDIAKDIFTLFPTCKTVTLRLLLNRHVVVVTEPI